MCLLGVCYGRPEQISGIAHRELETRGVGLRVGREFWEFIGEDPDTMAGVVELAAETAASLEAGDESYNERVVNSSTRASQYTPEGVHVPKYVRRVWPSPLMPISWPPEGTIDPSRLEEFADGFISDWSDEAKPEYQ